MNLAQIHQLVDPELICVYKCDHPLPVVMMLGQCVKFCSAKNPLPYLITLYSIAIEV